MHGAHGQEGVHVVNVIVKKKLSGCQYFLILYGKSDCQRYKKQREVSFVCPVHILRQNRRKPCDIVGELHI